MNYQVNTDAALLHSVHLQAKMLSSMRKTFVKAMSFQRRFLTHSLTTAGEEKKSQQFLPMMCGVTTLEDVQRERVVELAKIQCQSVLLHSMEGGFTSSLLCMVNVNDISALTSRRQQQQQQQKQQQQLHLLVYKVSLFCI